MCADDPILGAAAPPKVPQPAPLSRSPLYENAELHDPPPDEEESLESLFNRLLDAETEYFKNPTKDGTVYHADGIRAELLRRFARFTSELHTAQEEVKKLLVTADHLGIHYNELRKAFDAKDIEAAGLREELRLAREVVTAATAVINPQDVNGPTPMALVRGDLHTQLRAALSSYRRAQENEK